MSSFFFQPRTVVQSLYYDFHRTHGRGAAMLPFITEPAREYLAKYVLLNEFHRHLQPFSFLKPGDRAVMAGIHEGYIGLGLSTLFVMSALVGDGGHVFALDPDDRNIAGIEAFIAANAIRNVTVLRKAVWKKKSSLKFFYFKDFSSSNLGAAEFRKQRATLERLWGKARIAEQTYTVDVDVETLDTLCRTELGGPVDFVNLTINGAELDAIRGAQTLVEAGATFAFPLRTPRSPLYADLRRRGYSLGVADAPTKAWSEVPFLYACATKCPPVELRARGFVPVDTRDLEGGTWPGAPRTNT